MEFSFKPFTDEELAAQRGLLPEGEYPFQVKEIKPMISKALNPMLQLMLSVIGPDKVGRLVIDYLSADEKMSFKIKRFLESVGLGDKYATGKFNIYDAVGRSGKLALKVEKGKINPNGGNYPDRNAVKDYLVKSTNIAASGKADSDFNDDITF